MTKTKTTCLIAAGLALLTLLACGGCAKRTPLPIHLQLTNGLVELRQRMAEARPKVEKYSAEIRMTYFGSGGKRVKGSAILAVSRPSSMRYDVLGPHGGVLEAFATNGKQMQLLLPNDQLFVHGPASAENIDKLMRLAPLHRDAEGWVAMLFGEVDPPAEAGLRFDEASGRFLLSWEERGLTLTVAIDPETSRVVRATMAKAGELISEVEITGRDAKGIPTALAMRAPGAGAEGGDVDVRVVLRDLEYDSATLSPSDFQLAPPRGFALQNLETLGAAQEEPPSTPPAEPAAGEPEAAEPATTDPKGEPAPQPE